MVNNEAIIAELGNHPYTPEDKITFGGASHYCKVFKLGSGKIEIVYKSGNAGAICEAMSTTECIDKNGIIVDGTDVYVLKETSPRGTFARYVVLETNTGMQLKGIVDASSVSLTKGQSIGIINGGGSSYSLPTTGDYKGQVATCEDGSSWIWNGTQWICYDKCIFSIAREDTFNNDRWNWLLLGDHLDESKSFAQINFDFTFTNNARFSFTGNLSAKILASSTAGRIDNSRIDVTCNPTSLVVGSTILDDSTSIHNMKEFLDVYIYFKPNGTSTKTGKYYLVVRNKRANGQTLRDLDIILTNIDVDDGWTLPKLGSKVTLGNNSAPTTEECGTAVGQVNYYTSVPVSTSANQMLVSDGNGGWKTKANVQNSLYSGYGYNPLDMAFTCWTPTNQILSPNKTRLFCLGYDKLLGAGRQFHYSFEVEMARHTNKSAIYKVQLLGLANKAVAPATDGTLTLFKAFVTRIPSGTAAGEYPLNYDTFWNGCFGKIVENKLYLYLSFNNPTANDIYTKFTLRNIVTDEDIVTSWDDETLRTFTDVNTNSLATNYASADEYRYTCIPMPSNADEGKILTVKNGLPSWEIA